MRATKKKVRREERVERNGGGPLHYAYVRATRSLGDTSKDYPSTNHIVLVDGDRKGSARLLIVHVPARPLAWITPTIARERAAHLMLAANLAEIGRSASHPDLDKVLEAVGTSSPERRKVREIVQAMKRYL